MENSVGLMVQWFVTNNATWQKQVFSLVGKSAFFFFWLAFLTPTFQLLVKYLFGFFFCENWVKVFHSISQLLFINR